MTNPLLMLDNITFSYATGERRVLESFSLQIEPHTVTAILGPNGSGKTTLLRLALGKERPQSGKIWLDGKTLGAYSRRELGQWMGLVPQNEHLHFDYSLLEYTVLGRAPYLKPLEMPSEEDCRIALKALEKVGLGEMPNRPVTNLSGGEKQLALVARALTQQPRLLLLDEPTAHLDLSNKLRLLELFKELADQGITILLTTHEPEVASGIATHLVMMREGKIKHSGKLEETFTSENLSQTYQVHVEVIQLDGRRIVYWQ